MKVKLSDLAKELNISVAAVSMALNDKKGVSEETRDIILELARQKGYSVRTKTADKEQKRYIKLLRLKKHGLIAVDTAFFAKVVEGIEDECKKSGYELLVSYYNLVDLEKDIVEETFADNIDGFIVFATELENGDEKIFCKFKKPFMILDSYFVDHEWNTVLMNNFNAAYQAIKYMAGVGHTQIGYLKSSKSIYNFEQRFKGYLESLKMMGLNYTSAYTIELEPTLQGAEGDMERILGEKKLSELPTAFLADNDIIAAGAMNAFKTFQIKVPEDVSVIGIDDMPFCEMIQPKLTTIKIYKEEMGREAVKVLLTEINEEFKYSQKREIETKLIIRDSVKFLK